MEHFDILSEKEQETWPYESINFSHGRSMKLKDLKDLILKPRHFFSGHIALVGNMPSKVAFALMGLAVGLDRVLQYANRSFKDFTSTNLLHENWWAIWLLALLVGPIALLMKYWIGGWWYNVRIGWSGVKSSQPQIGRILYLYNGLFIDSISILYTLIGSFVFTNYLDSQVRFVTWYDLSSLIILSTVQIMCYVNSYKSVKGIYPVKKGLAALWFLVLPTLALLSGYLMMTIAGILLL